MRYRILSIALGTAIFAGPAAAQHHDHQLGDVDFAVSCSPAAQDEVRQGVAQLHHMMYEQARPHFRAAAEADTRCAMAHWGIAMTSFQPLWHPTSEAGLERGRAAVETARSLGAPTERERAYIAAVEAFFTDPAPPAPDRSSDHQARVRAWMEAQRQVHEAHPDDTDAAALYALATVAYAQTRFSPTEEPDYTRQRRAGEVLQRYLAEHPEHPGLQHYLIHAYDSPALAHEAEAVADRYDRLAPETTHALHMPSHIFVRIGDWERTVGLNERAAEAALRALDANPDAILHYVHALDYVMYGYLQEGDEENARRTLARLQAVEDGWPALAFAYGVAAPQARYHLERHDWVGAAQLEPRQPAVIAWEDYPAAAALFHYARGLGAARSGDLTRAEAERAEIARAAEALRADGDDYWAHLTEVLGDAVEAWVLYERGDTDRAVALMGEAADREDSLDKHPITPGEVLPVRELYAEMLLIEGRAREARRAYEQSLERTPNRRNALAGLEQARAAM